MGDLVAHTERVKGTLAALAACGLCVLGIYLTVDYSEHQEVVLLVVGVILAVTCGVFAPVVALRTFRRSEQLRVNESGIRSLPYSDQTIPWSEIADVGTYRKHGHRSIILRLRDRSRFPAKGLTYYLAGANRLVSSGDVSISLAHTDRTFDEAMSAIERFRSSAPG